MVDATLAPVDKPDTLFNAQGFYHLTEWGARSVLTRLVKELDELDGDGFFVDVFDAPWRELFGLDRAGV